MSVSPIAEPVSRRNIPCQCRSRTEASVFAALPWPRIATVLGLTPRELQVVQQLFASRTEGEIAEELGIAARTVHTHLEHIHRKMEVRSRAELLTRVIATYLQHCQPFAGTPEFEASAPVHCCRLRDNRLCPLGSDTGPST